jgi:voltage-gated potassium channel Kch
MTRQVTTRDRLRYRFDATLSRGTVGIIGWLAIVTFIFVMIAGVLIVVLGIRADGEARTSFIEGVWLSLLRTLDPGTMGGDAGWRFRFIALGITIIGIFIVSTLIGLISSGIDRTVDELRKGRSLVVEDGHTLILGWSPKIHQILNEIEVANENQRHPSVVILAPHDKVDMEDEVKARASGPRRTRVVCRSGDPSDPADLELVRPLAAKSVLILADQDAGDPQTVKNDVISRITAQVCRQAGLSYVFQDLLDFDGDEIYFQAEPRLIGHTFGDCLTLYESSSVIGVRAADGTITLSPSMMRVFAEGDQVIAISADDDTVKLDGEVIAGQAAASASEPPLELKVEHTLVVGWNAMGPRILNELERYVSAGSTVRVLLDPARTDGASRVAGSGSLELEFIEMDTVDGNLLAAELGRGRYDQIIILCYRGEDIAASDARTLLTLLQIRQVTEDVSSPNHGVRLVAELLDARDVELARIANPDDFVVSERLTSLMLAQLSENAELRGVFADLFDAEGVELVLVPASRYVATGAEQSYADVVAAARRRGHVCVGYRCDGGENANGALGGGVVLNPPKSKTVTFAEDDQILVLA